MTEAASLSRSQLDDLIETAAADATLSVIKRLPDFEGRSRFTTWAYKFALLQTGVLVRRAAWRDRNIESLNTSASPRTYTHEPSAVVESAGLADALREAFDTALTERQRRVAIALLVEGVPIDILAERLGTTRGALYKALHDVRVALRKHLTNSGWMTTTGNSGEVFP